MLVSTTYLILVLSGLIIGVVNIDYFTVSLKLKDDSCNLAKASALVRDLGVKDLTGFRI